MKLETTIDELKKYSLFVGVPMYGGQCAGLFCKSTNELAKVCATYGIEVKFYYLFNESLVQRARNYIADEFYRSEYTHLLFIDADIGFNPKDVLSMLALQTSNPDKLDIVTGPYPKKTIAWEKVKEAVKKGKADENPFNLEYYYADYVFNPIQGTGSFKINEPLEVSESGTGFMLIPKNVLEKYREAYPQYLYKPDHLRTQNFDGSRDIMAFFDCEIDPVSRRYLSEDYFFCQKARQIGIKIHLCPWMELQHVGTYTFRGSLGALGSLGETATADEKSNPKSYTKNKKRAFRP
jgi:hypothetical protein